MRTTQICISRPANCSQLHAHAPQLQRNADQGDSPDRCRGCLCSGVVHAPALPMHMDGVLHALGHLGSISACVVTTLQLAPFGRVPRGSRSSTVCSDRESPRPTMKTFLGSLESSSRVLIRGMHWSERLGHMESWRVALQLEEDGLEYLGFGIGISNTTKLKILHSSKQNPNKSQACVTILTEPKPQSWDYPNTKPACQGWLLTSKPKPRQMPGKI